MGRGHKTTKAGITECEHDLQEVNSSFYRNTLAARAMGMLRGDFPHTGRERPTPFAFLSLVGRRRICLNRKRHATAFATQYRRPNIEPRVLLLMACLPRHALPPSTLSSWHPREGLSPTSGVREERRISREYRRGLRSSRSRKRKHRQ